MAPRSKKEDDKSAQLDAAAVGAGTELVQAQAEPLQSVALEQAAEAQGMDLVAEAANQAAMRTAEEMSRIQEAQVAEIARLEAEQQSAANQANADWLLGQFDVKAKSPAGFWRCKVQFLHSSPTRVFVVENKADVPHDHDCAIPCCYLTPEEAQRVHQDSWLTVVTGSEMTKD